MIMALTSGSGMLGKQRLTNKSASVAPCSCGRFALQATSWLNAGGLAHPFQHGCCLLHPGLNGDLDQVIRLSLDLPSNAPAIMDHWQSGRPGTHVWGQAAMMVKLWLLAQN